MFSRVLIIVCALVLSAGLLAGTAAAQIPTAGNVYFGYTYYNTDLSVNRGNLNGWEGTLEGKLFPYVGIVADISGHYGNTDLGVICPVVPVGSLGGGGCTTFNVSTHLYEVMFGPRVSVSIGKFRPFGEFEVGVGHVSTNGFGSDTSFATAVGGGLDYKIFRPLAWRFQGDYVRTHFFTTGQNNLRLSTGIVLRF
jgi:opacity protein-like surface antigen